jgi:CRP-like cAMP-binding protein
VKVAQPVPSWWAPGSFLARLPRTQVTELLSTGTRRVIDAGRPLMRQGDRSTHVELILRGFVKITNLVDGAEVLMGIRVPGDFVGELAGLTDKPRIATAVACGRVMASVVSKADFHRFLKRYPDAAMSMTAVVGERLRWANERRTDAAYPVEVRLARLLVEIAMVCGRDTEEGVTIAVPLSQPELASMISVSEATVQKVLRDLRERGLLRTGYRRLTLLDMAALRARGEGTGASGTMTG